VRRRSWLAHLSHQGATAAAHLRSLVRDLSLRALGVASATPALPSVEIAHHPANLHGLATRPNEKSGLRPVFPAWLAAACVLWSSAAGASEGGLVIFPEPGMLVILIAFFVVLRFLLHPVLFRPLLSVLDERRERTLGTRVRAEELIRRSEADFQRYREALREARTGADRERQLRVAEARAQQVRVVAEARAGAEGEIEAARAEIAQSLAAVRADLRVSAEVLAREAALRVLGRAT